MYTSSEEMAAFDGGYSEYNYSCPNPDCQWKGNIKDVAGHLSMCQINDCGGKMERMKLEMHESPKHIISCPHCEEIGTHDVISTSNHLDKCPLLPVKCSNDDCEVVCPRNTLSVHEGDCPKGIITCEYSSVGCVKRMKREEQEEHNASSVKEHLQFAVSKINSLQHNQTQLLPNSKVFKLSNYSVKKANNQDWCSPSFYTSLGGYKMSLIIFANGYSAYQGTHISCYTRLLPGEYDDALEWPFRGEVIVELLNQAEDKNHKKHTIKYNKLTLVGSKERVAQGGRGGGWGCPEFIPHSELDYNSNTNCHYLKDDCLYFRVTVHASSKTKPWLSWITAAQN